jgi:hypothetical protein
MPSITTLPDYIKALGDQQFSARYGVKLRTAASWRRRERYPRPKQARALVERSGGELSLNAIYARD